MKIAYIFAYFGDGGAEAHALILAKKARESGNEPIFIIDHFSTSARKKLDDNNFECVDLPMESSFNPIKLRRSVKGLKKIIKQKQIDLVHAHMLREQTVANFAKMSGSRFILVRTFHRFDQFNWKMRPLMSLYRKHTDAFISISDKMTDYLAANGIVKNVHTITNGVEKVEVSQHGQAIGFIGRLTHEKGILAFIEENIVLLGKTKLVIAGDGPDYEEINKLVNRECLDVELLGNVTNRAEFFSKISVLILPSETEVMPMVVLEAYSCGTPVVAFDVDALARLILPENGKIIPFPNYAEMATAAVEMLSNISAYSQANISAFDRSYSADIMWQKTFELYTALSKH